MPRTPKAKTRLSVSITPESRAALEQFSEVSGVAMAQFISSLVHDSVPIIQAMTQAYKVARSSPRQASSIMETQFLRTMADAAQTKLEFDEAAKTPRLRKQPRKPPR
jgi:hypothetical protein